MTNPQHLITRIGHWLLVFLPLLASCSLRGGLAAESTATPLPASPTSSATRPPAPSPTATLAQPTATPAPTSTLAPLFAPVDPTASPAGPPPAHFLLVGRPVPPHASLSVVASYRYGSTNERRYDTHHGVEFANPANTQLLAVAPGTVLWAGDDLAAAYGPSPNFYGFLVVLQLDETWQGHAVYALYGHMLAVAVAPGQAVETGDLVGYVGQSGVALGPHLHLEVRLDNPMDYDSTRNPELWLRPLPGTGLLAGRVLDSRGRPVRDARVNIACEDGKRRFADTYHDDTVTPDDVFQENFAIGDVPVGECELSVAFVGGTVKEPALVNEGELTLVEFIEP